MTDDFDTLRAWYGRTDTVELRVVEPRPPTWRQLLADMDPFTVGVAVGLLLGTLLLLGGGWLLTVACGVAS